VTARVAPRLATLAVVSALALTGCGGGDEPKDRADCGSAKERTEHLTKDTAVDALRSAAGDSITQHVRMQVESGDETFVMEGDGDSGADAFTAMDVEMDQGDGHKLRMIYVDGVLYLSGAGLAKEGKFVKVDPDDASDPLAAAMKPALEGTGLADSLETWEAALIDVQFDSDEVLEDGTEAEKYTFLMDSRAALAVQRPGKPLPSGIPEKLANDVWVDSHNLVRRVEFTLDGARTVVTMSDYCEPIDVEAPDEDDVVDRNALTGR
jgi:hypothetical protein